MFGGVYFKTDEIEALFLDIFWKRCYVNFMLHVKETVIRRSG